MSDIFIDIRGLIGTSKPRFHDPFDEGRRRTGGKGRGGFVSRLSSQDRGEGGIEGRIPYSLRLIGWFMSRVETRRRGRVKRGRDGNENENIYHHVSFRFVRRSVVTAWLSLCKHWNNVRERVREYRSAALPIQFLDGFYSPVMRLEEIQAAL